MTKIFYEINNDFYHLEQLTYNSETKVFTVLTERVGDWERVNFKCPEESENYTFIKSLYFQSGTRKHEECRQNFPAKNSRLTSLTSTVFGNTLQLETIWKSQKLFGEKLKSR